MIPSLKPGEFVNYGNDPHFAVIIVFNRFDHKIDCERYNTITVDLEFGILKFNNSFIYFSSNAECRTYVY